MRFIQHETNNAVLAAPPGISVDQCRPLPITRVQYADGTPAVWSFWEPDERERAAIAAGAPIRFEALGQTHPPISLSVDGLEPA